MDNMPPLPDADWFVWCQNAYEDPYYSTTEGYTADQMHAYARAYAAQRCAPLVEALERLIAWDGLSVGRDERMAKAHAALAAHKEHSNG